MVFESINLSLSSQVWYWHAHIAVSAAAGGCTVPYTEDLGDGQLLAGVRVVNPFRRHGG